MTREPTDSTHVLIVEDLHVRFTGRDEDAVRGVSLHVDPGETVALVGESGSGKSATALASMGLLPRNAHPSGSVRLSTGAEVVGAAEDELDDLRGRVASMVFQEPLTALNPSMTLGRQIGESIRNHSDATAEQAMEKAVGLIRAVGLPDPETKARQYPHELSGGQRQRIVIAIALASEPDLIIADEPTTALDVTVQAEILDLLRHLVQERGKGQLLITHNMGVVADLADRVYVMRHGVIVESGEVEQVLTRPQHPYTKALLAAIPRLPPASLSAAPDATGDEEPAAPTIPEHPVVVLSDVYAGYRVGGRHVPVVEDIDLAVGQGEIVGLVGESGSGKSTIGRLVLGLLKPQAGDITLLGEPLSSLHGRRRRRLLGEVGVVFQDPGGSLDPRMTVGESVAEPLAIHDRSMTASARRARVAELLAAVKLPADSAGRYPHEFSGGQRQRIGLARALVRRPRLVVADEPTSALDVSVQAEVLAVLRGLHADLGFGCLFISHDLGVINEMTGRVVVLRHGRIVEQGTTDSVLRAPRRLYTKELLTSVPTPDPAAQRARRQARHALSNRSGKKEL